MRLARPITLAELRVAASCLNGEWQVLSLMFIARHVNSVHDSWVVVVDKGHSTDSIALRRTYRKQALETSDTIVLSSQSPIACSDKNWTLETSDTTLMLGLP